MDLALVTETQLGHLLQGYRRARKLNQTQLARRAGMSQARLSTLEPNPGRITVAQLLRIAAALGLEIRVREKPAGYPGPPHDAASPAAGEALPPEW